MLFGKKKKGIRCMPPVTTRYSDRRRSSSLDPPHLAVEPTREPLLKSPEIQLEIRLISRAYRVCFRKEIREVPRRRKRVRELAPQETIARKSRSRDDNRRISAWRTFPLTISLNCSDDCKCFFALTHIITQAIDTVFFSQGTRYSSCLLKQNLQIPTSARCHFFLLLESVKEAMQSYMRKFFTTVVPPFQRCLRCKKLSLRFLLQVKNFLDILPFFLYLSHNTKFGRQP